MVFIINIIMAVILTAMIKKGEHIVLFRVVFSCVCAMAYLRAGQPAFTMPVL